MELMKRYGPFDHVYLATDNRLVIREAKRDLPRRLLVHQALSGDFYWKVVDGSAEFNSEEAVQAIARDIWAMGKCRAFVGSMASSIGWIAYELMIARHGHYVPFVSVDGVLTPRLRRLSMLPTTAHDKSIEVLREWLAKDSLFAEAATRVFGRRNVRSTGEAELPPQILHMVRSAPEKIKQLLAESHVDVSIG